MHAAGIRFVLVEPQHPGNIGAVARAMKNMALDALVLVRPHAFPHAEATARASGADDVLARARVTDTIADAVADCGLVVATTARDRMQRHRVLDVREAAGRIVDEAHRGPVAVLFGGERAGLANEDLECAHLLLGIPANPSYNSLNVAMAAQLVAYEVHRALGATGAGGAASRKDAAIPREAPLAPASEMAQLYAHIEAVLGDIDFRDHTQSGTHLMARIRRMFQRAELDQNEVNILRGILTAVQGRRRPAGTRQ